MWPKTAAYKPQQPARRKVLFVAAPKDAEAHSPAPPELSYPK